MPGDNQPDNNFLPANHDEQDRPYNYYAPMQDIFLRPRLPRLIGPAALIGTSVVMRAIPAGTINRLATVYAIKFAYNNVRASVLSICGNALMNTSRALALISVTQGLVPSNITLAVAQKGSYLAGNLLQSAARLTHPKLMRLAAAADTALGALRVLAWPTFCAGVVWGLYTLARHLIEPPPYEAPPGCYPSGGPIVEISQEEAPNREMVFTCPAPLARLVQERVLLCERDPTIIQKVKTIASRWCDGAGIQGNQRYAAICGAVASALTVPVNEQLVLQLSQSHAVQTQYSRIARYLSGIKHTHDAWWTKYFSLRR